MNAARVSLAILTPTERTSRLQARDVTALRAWAMQGDEERARAVAAARKIGARHMHHAWSSMHAIAVAHGWPLGTYAADLYIYDRGALARAAPHGSIGRFVWAIGAHGTYLSWIARAGDRRLGYSEAHGVADFLDREYPQRFLWDGARLIAIDTDRCCALLRGEED